MNKFTWKKLIAVILWVMFFVPTLSFATIKAVILEWDRWFGGIYDAVSGWAFPDDDY